jgi:hypothetical protein
MGAYGYLRLVSDGKGQSPWLGQAALSDEVFGFPVIGQLAVDQRASFFEVRQFPANWPSTQKFLYPLG